MSTSKTERDQWRERLSSPYTCFNAAHADFTIRLLDALEEVEAEKERLEREADWLAHGYTNAVDLLGMCARICPQSRGGREMNTTVQKAINDGMKAPGITQTELAIVLRSRARASEIINGKRDLRRTELLVLSYLLHIPLETLMPPLSEEDKLHIDSLIAWERKLQETRYIKERTSKRSKKACPKN